MSNNNVDYIIKVAKLLGLDKQAIDEISEFVEVGNKRINMGELRKNLELKQEYGDIIDVPVDPGVTIIDAIPALYSKEEDNKCEPVDISDSLDVLKESANEYLAGAIDFLKRIGITKEADQQVFLELLGA